ncbi:fasciclin domain-containing protein [Alistipes sp. OttesenSCG-928-B03]|nr:fasciclin domain-containing protein [Alistipes sp. OttesenSCG-928-B03]
MKNILLSLSAVAVLLIGMASCNTNYGTIDTGKANAHYDGNMYEYLQSNSYDWDSVRVMVERAGMTDYFKSETFTFLGPTNHTIRRMLYSYLGKNGALAQLTDECCKDFVEMHIVEGKKILRDDIPRGVVNNSILAGGMFVTTKGGVTFALWTEQGSYQDIEGVGAVNIYVSAGDATTRVLTGTRIPVISGDIQPDNGVVQALTYNYIPSFTVVTNP